MTEDNGIELANNMELETWLHEHETTDYPPYSVERGEMPYPQRYENYKLALEPIHGIVEKGAMATGAADHIEETKNIIDIEDSEKRHVLFDKLTQDDLFVYLNNHGHGHVGNVISKVSEMLHFFENGHLTPYEGFFLLCAIQTHDVGNVYGRKDHEKRGKDILETKGKPYIPDGVERKVIGRLALVHGGAFDGNRDTISALFESRKIHGYVLRERLLAALLRFGDELADDSSRADNEGLAANKIPEGSRIYHYYSQALHTVKIERNPRRKVQLDLSYEIDSSLALQTFKKSGVDKYLLDEIYDRTLKMERERRYCMRFLRPYFSLDSIRVEIIIQHSDNLLKHDTIQYTLEENGYPFDPTLDDIKKFNQEIRTGEEEKKYIEKEWGKL